MLHLNIYEFTSLNVIIFSFICLEELKSKEMVRPLYRKEKLSKKKQKQK